MPPGVMEDDQDQQDLTPLGRSKRGLLSTLMGLGAGEKGPEEEQPWSEKIPIQGGGTSANPRLTDRIKDDQTSRGTTPQGEKQRPTEPFIGDKDWDEYSKWEYDKDVLQKQNPGMNEGDAEHELTSRHGKAVEDASNAGNRHVQDLEGQIGQLGKPAAKPSLKSRIGRAALQLAPVALGGVFGGSAGAEGAAEGEIGLADKMRAAAQHQNDENRQDKRSLQTSLEEEKRGQEQRTFQGGQDEANRQNQQLLERMRQAGDDRRFKPAQKTPGEQAMEYLVSTGKNPAEAAEIVANMGKADPELTMDKMFANAVRSGDQRTQQMLIDERKRWAAAGIQEPGSFAPVTDGQGNTVGAVDWKSGKFVPVGSVPGLAAATGAVPSPGAGPGGGPVIPPRPTAANVEKQQQANQAAQAALTYAQDYISKGKFTGAGDEMMLEGFFELAKPSSGFRMTQPQMQMLMDARGWKESIKGKMYHAMHGTWFSDQQRQEIADTMAGKMAAKLGAQQQRGPAAPGASAGVTHRFNPQTGMIEPVPARAQVQ